MNAEIRAHARGTVTRPTEPDDQIEYDRAHDSMQQGIICDEHDEDGQDDG